PADQGPRERRAAPGGHPRAARHPRARAALDRAVPSRGLRAGARLAARNEAERARGAGVEVPGRRPGAARGAAQRLEPAGALARPRGGRGRGGVRRAGLPQLAPGAAVVARWLVRRLAWGVATVLGVLLFLFLLFFVYAKPQDVARRALGEKAPPEVIAQWLANHGYDRPALWNPAHPLDTMLADHYRRMLTFDFGRSDADEVPIAKRLRRGVGP